MEERATTEEVPHATQCVDPLHVVQLANKAIDTARGWAWNLERQAIPKPKRFVGWPRKGSPPTPTQAPLG